MTAKYKTYSGALQSRNILTSRSLLRVRVRVRVCVGGARWVSTVGSVALCIGQIYAKFVSLRLKYIDHITLTSNVLFNHRAIHP